MPLTDQQLRTELLSYGETVPPITQRNREQLRVRLEVLRARPRSPIRSSSSRARSPVSPSRSTARSRPTRGLIELSDSETDISSNEYHASRSTGRETKVPTRSIAVKRDIKSPQTSNVIPDVEQSIARHRREIQQLIDSAREKSRAANANISSGQYEPPQTTPFRPNSASSHSRQPYKPASKAPSWFNRYGSTIRSYWENNQKSIISILRALLVGLLLGAGLIFVLPQIVALVPKIIAFVPQLIALIPHKKGITCSVDNATECDDMIPITQSVRNYLQTRKGEVDCGFRPKDDVRVTRPEINKYLDKQGYKFEMGTQERWNALIAYINDKPVDDILVWDNHDKPAQNVSTVYKLSATEGVHSLLCRAQKGVQSMMHHLAWLLLGTTGFLTLGWLFKRRSKQHEESENTYKDFVEKITSLLENQYEEHSRDPATKPWLAISHIRDMLIPPQDRKRLKALWERAKNQISQSESRVRSESQLIHGEEFDVWRWIQPRSPSSPSPQRQKRSESPQSSNEESYVYMPPDVGLTECLKLRNFFDPDTLADDDEIDLVVDSIQNRCATVRRIEHIGIDAGFAYLKFSSKESAAQGFHLLNNWKFHGREIVAKYLRVERYHQHFPEARDSVAT